MFDQSMVFLDVETTGATSSLDRITEIGFVEVANGEVVGEWSTLVNPGMRIPSAIESLTGISDAMVEDAPRFDQLSTELHRRLEGKLLVAHNARFDYGFLRNEFARVGVRYQSRVLCTVKLSRRLFPQERRHNLDSLIERHGIECDQRHRALADARVLWDFTRHVRATLGDEAVLGAIAHVMQTPNLPPGLDPATLDALPERAGVYVFFGASDTPLFVGKGSDIRSKVLAHFSGEARSAKDTRIARDVTRVDWIETMGELGTTLEAARLLRTLAPIHSRLLQHDDEACAFMWDSLKATPPVLMNAGEIDFAMAAHLYGPFRSPSRAKRALREIADANGLCLRVLGLERSAAGPCHSHTLKKCRGACCGRESLLSHNVRAANALQRHRLETWPFEGRIGVRESDPVSGRQVVHVLDRWCHLGTLRSESELFEALETRFEPVFDLDTYQVLVKWLARRRHELDIVDLRAAYRKAVGA